MALLVQLDERGRIVAKHPLTLPVTTMGRNADNAIVINDARVSRHHAKVELAGSAFSITDQQSTHMTLVNGEPVDSSSLNHGDLLSLGAKVEFFFVEADDDAEIQRLLGEKLAAEGGQDIPKSEYSTYVTQEMNTLFDSLRTTTLDASSAEHINEKIARSIQELQCLYEVGKALNSELELQKVLQLIIRHVITATSGERGYIMLQTSDGQLVPVVARNMDGGVEKEDRYTFSTSIARKCLETQQTIVARDTSTDPNITSKSIVDYNIRSAICAPLIAGGRAMGTLYVDAKESLKEFSESDKAFFSALANQSAVAIENARLMSDLRDANDILRRKVKEMQALYEVSQSLNAVNNLDSVLATILDKSIEAIGSERGSIMLLDQATDLLQVRVVRGALKLDRPGKIQLKRGEGIAGQVVATGKGLISNVGHQDPQFVGKAPRESDIRHILCVPLIVKGQTIGAINLINKLENEEFDEADLRLLTSLATHAAQTIDNSRLYNLAVFDGLTNVYVHRYFQTWFAKEFDKAKRYKSDLSIILIDIDHFKKFNDTYGHQIGDLVLVEMAKVFKDSVRSVDLVARYGGEEFVIVLPETNLAGAELFAERVRATVEAHRIDVRGKQLQVTISLGVANYLTSHPKDAKQFINFSDEALYKAKRGGRNCYLSHRPPLSSRDLADQVKQRLDSGIFPAPDLGGES